MENQNLEKNNTQMNGDNYSSGMENISPEVLENGASNANTGSYGNIENYKSQMRSFNEPSNYGESNSFSNNDLISPSGKGERNARTLRGEYEGDYLQPEADLTITETGSIVDAAIIRCNSLILDRGTIKSQKIEAADAVSIAGKKGLELETDINTLQLILENPYKNEKTGEIVYKPFRAHIKITFIE